MGIKNKLFLIFYFLFGFFTFADNYKWSDSILQKKYSDNQISYWVQIINDAIKNSEKKKISDTEFIYQYKWFSICEDMHNISGASSKSGIPCIIYKIKSSEHKEINISVFVEKNGDITLQVWGEKQRLLFIRYFDEKYHYTYFENGKVAYSFETS